MDIKRRMPGSAPASARVGLAAALVVLAVVAASASIALAHADAAQEQMEASGNQEFAAEAPAQQIATDEEARALLDQVQAQGVLAYSGVSKEETVHASLKPDGGIVGLTSRVTLKNAEGLDVLADRTALTQVELSDGDQAFARSGQDLAFDAQGEDVSYSGVSVESLPVGVEVEYRLDGKELAPAALVGKSGKVSITYRFSNETSTPFAAVGILELDDERFSDVAVDNGKVMAGSEAATVVGLCFPGLQSQVDVNGLDLPSSFTLTAQVTDFCLDSATLLITPSLFEDLDSIEFDSSDLSQATGAFDELHHALDELAEGAGSLSTGADELQQGLAELAAGVDQVNIGASASSSGAGEGAGEALAGLAAQQSSAVEDLATTLETAELTDEQRAEVEASLSQLGNTNERLANAAVALQAQDPSAAEQQLAALGQGIDEAAAAAAQLSVGASQLKAGIAAFDEEGIDALETGISDMVSQFDDAAESLDDVAARARAYQTFSGKPDGVEGSVLFVYQIDALG